VSEHRRRSPPLQLALRKVISLALARTFTNAAIRQAALCGREEEQQHCDRTARHSLCLWPTLCSCRNPALALSPDPTVCPPGLSRTKLSLPGASAVQVASASTTVNGGILNREMCIDAIVEFQKAQDFSGRTLRTN